jgi:glucose-6-phosphate 1-dehydrogenase
VVELKRPGTINDLLPVELDMMYGDVFKAPLRDAYERLLVDALHGDALLFMREDEIDAGLARGGPAAGLLAHRPRGLPELRRRLVGPRGRRRADRAGRPQVD